MNIIIFTGPLIFRLRGNMLTTMTNYQLCIVPLAALHRFLLGQFFDNGGRIAKVIINNNIITTLTR